MIALQEGLGYKPRKLFLNQHTMNRLAVIGFWLFLPFNPQNMGELVDQRFDYYSLQAQKGNEFQQISLPYIWTLGLNVRSVVDWLAMQKVGYYWALNGQFIRHEALLKRVRIFSSLKQFYITEKQWPATLEKLNADPSLLIDPLNQMPFLYQRVDDHFLFYSLGVNGLYDGGQYSKELNQDDIQIWPQKSRLQEEDE
jgi:hypothetical protein